MPRSDDQDLKFNAPPKQITLWPWLLGGAAILCLCVCFPCIGGVAFYFIPRAPSQQYMVGVWQHEGWLGQVTTYEFRSDGTGRLSNRAWSQEFTYTIQGTHLTLNAPRIDNGHRRIPLPAQKRVWRSGSDLIIEDEEFFRNRLVLERLQ